MVWLFPRLAWRPLDLQWRAAGDADRDVTERDADLDILGAEVQEVEPERREDSCTIRAESGSGPWKYQFIYFFA